MSSGSRRPGDKDRVGLRGVGFARAALTPASCALSNAGCREIGAVNVSRGE